RNTGMCMGSSMLPIWGICPVKKGSTSPRAKNRAARVKFFRFLDMVHFSLSQTRNEAGCDSLTLCQLLYNKKAELASPCGPAGSAVLDQTIKQVPTGRRARTVGTHTGKLSAESVRAALRRVRGSALNFVPRGIPGG